MDMEQARTNMIKQQCRTWGVLDQQVLDLLQQVPREQFVPTVYQELAFADMAIPLGNGQAMLIPKEEARILETLHIQSNERVLEVGTGSGYFTALLAHQAKHVESVDIFADFTEQASHKLSRYNLHNVILHTADAAMGFKKNLMFDVIVITGSVPFLPKIFRQQVPVGGRLFAFIGQAPVMQATLFTHSKLDQWENTVLFETYVEPLLNALQSHQFVF